MLSRVDGQSSYDDICKVTGLGRDVTLEILRGLRQAKLILGPGESPVGGGEAERPAKAKLSGDSKRAPVPPVACPPGDAAREPLVTRGEAGVGGDCARSSQAPGPLERLDDGTHVSASELEEWPEADPLLKERIIRLHRRIKKLSAFELLGVAPQADKGTIRRAFTIASKELHPDRYFGKNLGSFKPKLAAIFARLTEAVQEIEDGQKGKR